MASKSPIYIGGGIGIGGGGLMSMAPPKPPSWAGGGAKSGGGSGGGGGVSSAEISQAQIQAQLAAQKAAEAERLKKIEEQKARERAEAEAQRKLQLTAQQQRDIEKEKQVYAKAGLVQPTLEQKEKFYGTRTRLKEDEAAYYSRVERGEIKPRQARVISTRQMQEAQQLKSVQMLSQEKQPSMDVQFMQGVQSDFRYLTSGTMETQPPKFEGQVITQPILTAEYVGTPWKGEVAVSGVKLIDPFGEVLGKDAYRLTKRPATEEEKIYYEEQVKASKELVAGEAPPKVLREAKEIYGLSKQRYREFEAGSSAFLKEARLTDKNINRIATTLSNIQVVSAISPKYKEYSKGAIAGTLIDIRDKPAKNIILFGAGAGIGFGAKAAPKVVGKIVSTISKERYGVKLESMALGQGFGVVAKRTSESAEVTGKAAEKLTKYAGISVGVGLTGIYVADIGTKVFLAPTYYEKGQITGIAIKDLAVLGIGARYGTRAGSFFFDEIKIKTPIRKVMTPEAKELQFSVVSEGRETTKAFYKIYGEYKPPFEVKTTTAFREYYGLKPKDLRYIPSKKYMVETMYPAELNKPFLVSEVRQGKRTIKVTKILGESEEFNPRIELGKLTKTERYALGKMVESKTRIPISDKMLSQYFTKDVDLVRSYIKTKDLLVSKPKEYIDILRTGKFTRRSQAITRTKAFIESEKIDIFLAETYFKDVTYPFARASGKTPKLKTTLYKIKEPFVLDSEPVEFIKPADIIKTPLSKTFAPQITEQVQIPKELPKVLPKQTRVSASIERVSPDVSVSQYAGTGLYERTDSFFVYGSKELSSGMTKELSVAILKESISLGVVSELKSELSFKNLAGEKLITDLKVESILKTSPELKTETLLKPLIKFKEIEKLKEEQKLKQTLKLKELEKIKPISQKILPPPEPPKEPSPGLFDFDLDLEGEYGLSGKGQGYNVYAKELKQKKYSKLTDKPVSKQDAMDLLAYGLDNSVARSGYIKPSKQKAKPMQYDIPEGYYYGTQDKFRPYKIREGKKIAWKGIIEKSMYGIDTIGEKRQLKVFKALAEKKKREAMLDIMEL